MELQFTLREGKRSKRPLVVHDIERRRGVCIRTRDASEPAPEYPSWATAGHGAADFGLASVASSVSTRAPELLRTRVRVHSGRQTDDLVWTGKAFALCNEHDAVRAGTAWWLGKWSRLRNRLMGAFFPDADTVSEDYWNWSKFRCVHRYFSQLNQMFSTQSLLYALNLGAKKTLAASATINWMMKDGLGRIARMSVATSFAQDFDSEIKRVRWTSALIFAASIAFEYATPFFPRHFVPLAGVANVGKAVSLTAHVSTQPAVMRSFSREENLADISAKCQAQNMIMDNVGIATAAALTWVVRKHMWWRAALPLMMYPVAVAGDLFGIYGELRAVHLRTLNRTRAEMLFGHLLATGEVLTPAFVSANDHLLLPSDVDRGPLRLQIVSVRDLADDPRQLEALLAAQGDAPFMLALRRGRSRRGARLVVAFRQGASHRDILTAVLAACVVRHSHIRSVPCRGCLDRALRDETAGSTSWGSQGKGHTCSSAVDERLLRDALAEAKRLITDVERVLEREGWQCQSFLLSKSERSKYSIRSQPLDLGPLRGGLTWP